MDRFVCTKRFGTPFRCLGIQLSCTSYVFWLTSCDPTRLKRHHLIRSIHEGFLSNSVFNEGAVKTFSLWVWTVSLSMLASKILALSVAVSMSFYASKTSHLSLLQIFTLLAVTVTKQPPVRSSLPSFFHLSGNLDADCFLLLKCCDDLQNLLVECRLLVKMSTR